MPIRHNDGPRSLSICIVLLAGEDRWMCTLMMLRGWKLKYSTFGINTTYCPNTVDEFVKQRRRWVLSDLANTFLVFRNIIQLLRNNHCFTFMYIVYMLQLFIIILLSPGSTVIMLTAGMDMVFGISFVYFTPAVCAALIIYAILCMNVHTKLQTMITAVLMFALGVSMSCVVIGGVVFVVKDLIKGKCWA